MERVPRGRGRRADLDDRDRGRRGRPERDRDAGGERRAVRAGAAPPAPRPDRPRATTGSTACCSTDRPRTTRRRGPGSTRWCARPTGSSWPTRTSVCGGRGRCSTSGSRGCRTCKLARLAEDLPSWSSGPGRGRSAVEDDPGLAHELLGELRRALRARRSTGLSPVLGRHGSSTAPAASAGYRRMRDRPGARRGPARAGAGGDPAGLRPGPGGLFASLATAGPRGPGARPVRGDGGAGDRGALRGAATRRLRRPDRRAAAAIARQPGADPA